MSVTVESNILIDRPVAEVFAFATDWDKYPLWEAEVLESRQLSAGPTGVGTTYRYVARFIGRRLETEGLSLLCCAVHGRDCALDERLDI